MNISIYTDGSYTAKFKNKVGYAYAVLYPPGSYLTDYVAYGMHEDHICSQGRNVVGEIIAVETALEKIVYSLKNIVDTPLTFTIYHDYTGVAMWPDYKWKANLPYTQHYASYINALRKEGIDIKFVHVKGHSGNEYNDIVDHYAKLALHAGIDKLQFKSLGVEYASDSINTLPHLEDNLQ